MKQADKNICTTSLCLGFSLVPLECDFHKINGGLWVGGGWGRDHDMTVICYCNVHHGIGALCLRSIHPSPHSLQFLFLDAH